MTTQPSSDVRVTTAVKPDKTTAAPLVGAVEYLDDTPREKTITLQHPFKIGADTYREVTARKLTGKEIFAMNKLVRAGKAEPDAAMFSAMLRLPIAVIEALDAVDIATISKLAANFTPQSAVEEDEQTGENGENTQPK